MNKKLKEKIAEALSSVLPITLIVLFLSIFVVPLSTDTVLLFFVGAVLLIVGMGLFTLGAEMSMMPMGEAIGSKFTKAKKIWMIILSTFLMGFLITIAEPDLDVLASQVASIPDDVIIFTVAAGVGVFLVIAILRIIFQVSFSKLVIGLYIFVFALAIFVPDDFLPVSFDSGGVTTGPITVPFILALGVGLASRSNDKDANENSFGLVALCSIGPIIAVMLLGIIYHPSEATYDPVIVPQLDTMQDVAKVFAHELPIIVGEVARALLPLGMVFLLFQLFTKQFRKRQLMKMSVGFIYTFAGLVLFLTGVNAGFIPVGKLLGSELASENLRILLIPLGMLIGYFIVAAEPAVHVLNKQVEDVSDGEISAKAMKYTLSIGVAISVGLAMLRVLTGLHIMWFLIPLYGIALALSFFVPKIYVGIAFDSGGVASGPMTSTFLLPFAMGACEAVGGNIMSDAFGIVAMVAVVPLIAVQVLGLIYSTNVRLFKSKATEADSFPVLLGEEDE